MIGGFLRVLSAAERLRGLLSSFKVKSQLTTKTRRVEKIRSKTLLKGVVAFLRVLRAVQRLRDFLLSFKIKSRLTTMSRKEKKGR